jgi:uncharacterized membrane protein
MWGGQKSDTHKSITTPGENMNDKATNMTGKGRTPVLGMGALIGIGAGLGMVIGIFFNNLVLGLTIGAALGTVTGAVVESRRQKPPSERQP